MAQLLPDDPDADLVNPALDGDVDAFEALVRRYQRRIISLARGFTGDPADAEDLAQEVFVRVHRSLGRFRGDSLFRTWLYTIAMNVTRSHHSSRQRRLAVWQDSGAGDVTPFDPADTSADQEASLVRREAIDRALESLPADLRVAVTLRDVHGLDYKEIADAIGAPIGTVESRIFRGRQRLRVALAPLLSRG